VYAVRAYTKGRVVLVGNTREPDATVPDAHSIQTGPSNHVRMDLPARFLNHACGSAANVGARLPLNGNADQRDGVSSLSLSQWTPVYEFVALRDICAGEELRFDYETTEYQLQATFDCACGSPDCRGTLQGFGAWSELILQQHPRQWIAPYLLKTLLLEDEEDEEKMNRSSRASDP